MSPFSDDIHHTAHAAARDAHRAVVSARRVARRARFRATCDRTPWFFGSLLIGLGTLFLLDNLNVIEARWVFRNLWPLLILAFGLSRLFYGQGGERVFGAIAASFGGLWLVDRLFDVDINVMGIFWPLILIGLGISMLFRPRRWNAPPPVPPVPHLPGAPPLGPTSSFAEGGHAAAASTDQTTDGSDYVDQSATLREVAIMASIERRNVSQVFRGGSITAVMGNVEIDLRDTRMSDSGASIAIQVIMGQTVLRIPRDWAVESHLATVLGNLEDTSDRPVDASPKRLILEGSVFLGQVEIRN